MNDRFPMSRRRAVASSLALAAAFAPGVAFAARLLATPTQTPGPFYPSDLPSIPTPTWSGCGAATPRRMAASSTSSAGFSIGPGGPWPEPGWKSGNATPAASITIPATGGADATGASRATAK